MVTAQHIALLNEMVENTGLAVVWNAEQNIIIFQFADTNKATVDQWWHIVQMLAMDWDSSQPFNTVIEFANTVGLMTSYARQLVMLVANEFGGMYPDLHGRLAIVIPPTAQARFLRVFVQTVVHYGPRHFMFQIFNNRGAALHWVCA